MAFIQAAAAPKLLKLNFGVPYRITVPASGSDLEVRHYNELTGAYEPVNGSPIVAGEDLDFVKTEYLLQR